MANKVRRKKSLDTRRKPKMTNEQLQDFLAVAINSSKNLVTTKMHVSIK